MNFTLISTAVPPCGWHLDPCSHCPLPCSLALALVTSPPIRAGVSSASYQCGSSCELALSTLINPLTRELARTAPASFPERAHRHAGTLVRSGLLRSLPQKRQVTGRPISSGYSAKALTPALIKIQKSPYTKLVEANAPEQHLCLRTHKVGMTWHICGARWSAHTRCLPKDKFLPIDKIAQTRIHY